jgi:hypothetical protein
MCTSAEGVWSVQGRHGGEHRGFVERTVMYAQGVRVVRTMQGLEPPGRFTSVRCTVVSLIMRSTCCNLCYVMSTS